MDDLARRLAEPMPRRRALRVLGATIVAVAAPAPGARPARAATVAQPRCGPDRRVCREFTKDQYCCGRPSWQFFCGSKKGQCVNMCAGGTKFPCTALIAHPESGINGVCCDRRYHSRCRPVGKAATCCYGNPVTCKPMGEAACKKQPKRLYNEPPLWAPSERWKPSCESCRQEQMCENKRLDISDPSRWVCCVPPNTCQQGVCKCKDGRNATQCLFVGTHVYENANEIDGEIVGQKCCPESARYCCGTTCCKSFGCCGEKCCPRSTSVCASAGGRKVCCPFKRVTSIADNAAICCPAGTVANPSTGGCCPPGFLDCCRSVNCGEKVCVEGTCVNP